jgi:hypothetical protein
MGYVVKVGDLVRTIYDGEPLGNNLTNFGIIIEVIDHVEVPPVVKILWNSGKIDKEWIDELELINENR